ncbi:MAG: type II 3-dehydroquinate dehydratase, partial [Cellvibrionales bacterium]|nr:type II 3-dehydroquinate dehydratase [Cellvibrionales bacterium]
FRHSSYFSDIAQGIIIGLGTQSYSLALDAAVQKLTQNESN